MWQYSNNNGLNSDVEDMPVCLEDRLILLDTHK